MNDSKGQHVLGIAFLITLAFCVFEFIGGKMSGSLALIADAGHMLTDLSALGLALFASWMSRKGATPKMSFGFYRIEILAALVNGASLLTIAVFIVIEAAKRLSHPSEIQAPLMIAVAAIGLAVNLICSFLLSRHSHESLNLRAAFFHVIADALSSVGALAAGILILFTGWHWADAAASFSIAVLIVISSFWILKKVAVVLLEAAPGHINISEVERKILLVPGVTALHDLHIWSISSGKDSLSAHLEADAGADSDELLRAVQEIIARDFGIHHTTLQIEKSLKKCREDGHFH